jgi:type I restriction-modification system DNA methylase subunit
MDEINPNWYQLADQQGKGAALRPGSLGGLAKARRANRGEFYTPDAVANRMFEIVAPALQITNENAHAR